MQINRKNRIRLILTFIVIFIISFILAVKIVYLRGSSISEENFKESEGKERSYLQKGRIKMDIPGWIEWNPGNYLTDGPVSVVVGFRCDWVGQIFFSVNNGDETYLVYDDVREFVPGKYFEVYLEQLDNSIILALDKGNKPIRPPVSASGKIHSIKIRNSQSDLIIESIKIIEKQSGKTLAKINFGTDLAFSVLLLLALVLTIVVFAVMGLDILFFSKIFKRKAEILIPTFVAAYLPIGYMFMILDSDAFWGLLPGLIGICLSLRAYLAFFVGTEKRYLLADVKTFGFYAIYGMAFFFIGFSIKQFNLISSDVGMWIVAGGLLVALLAVLLFINRRKAQSALLPLSHFLIFPALANLAPFIIGDEGELNRVCWAFLGGFALICLALLSSVHKKIKLQGLYAILAVTIFLVCLEGGLRHSTYSARFRPMNIGKVFEPDKLLFWAPKDLFAPANNIQKVANFEVRQIKFRSGDASFKKDEGVYRILVLGGSNTWGQWIDDVDQVWNQRLEVELGKRYPNKSFEVLNAGVKGYNLFQLLVLYKAFLQKYEVDMILLYVHINDATASARMGMYTYRELFAMRSDKQHEELFEFEDTKKSGGPSWVAKTQSFLQNSTIYNALTKAILAFRSSDTGKKLDMGVMKSVNPVSDYMINLEEFAKIGREKGISIVFVDEFTFYDDGSTREIDEFTKAMAETAEKSATPFFDAGATMGEKYQRSKLVFPWDLVHLNHYGHEVLAKELADFIQSQGLVK